MTTTIFTPTYNRAYIITKLYDSLLSQTCFDFEWLIVDDGSSDNTEELVSGFNTDKFNITYIKQQNGGKHRAINRGVKIAKGELFFIVDSDDFLTPNAVEKIIKYWKGKDRDCLGLCFRKFNYKTGETIGRKFPYQGLYATSIQLEFVYNIKGDKAEIFRTDILRQYPFPEIEGENFCTENVCWLAMSKGKPNELLCADEPIYGCDYLEDGLSHNIKIIMKANPKGYILHDKQLLKIGALYRHPLTTARVVYNLLYLLFLIRTNK